MNSFSRRLIWCMLVISKISWLIRIFPFPPGPKAILSSAISNALAEFFVVDATTIESNLVSDAKISLKNVQLREQVHRLPVNSVGKSTKITITGTVESVEFRWAWVVSGSTESWVKDALLTIRGAKFKAALAHEDMAELRELSMNEPAEDVRVKYVDPKTIDSAYKRNIQKQGGLGAYIQRQGERTSLETIVFGCRLLTIYIASELGT